MFTVVLLMTSGMLWTNADFFATAKEQYNSGQRWEYIGRKQADADVPSLPLMGNDNKEYVYFKLK